MWSDVFLACESYVLMHWFHKNQLLYAKIENCHIQPAGFSFQHVDFT